MTAAKTKPVNVAPVFDFDDFESNVQQSTNIAYCQIAGVPNLPVSQLKTMNLQYGLFLPNEQTEAIGFTPSEDWASATLTFGEGDGEQTVEGWIATKVNLFVIHASQIEVQEKGQYGWKFVGLAYEKGKATEFNAKVEADKENYRRVNRLLLCLADKEGNPLHSQPLQLTARGGFGGSFGKECAEFYKQIDTVYFKAAKLAGKQIKGGKLDAQAHALALLSGELNYYKPEGKAPYICITSRLTPSIDQVGVSKEVDRNGRKVNLTGAPLNSLLFKKSSEAGKLILEWFDAYSDFPLPNAGRDGSDQPASDAAPFFATGEATDLNYLPSGDIEFVIEGTTVLVPLGNLQTAFLAKLDEGATHFSVAGLTNAKGKVVMNTFTCDSAEGEVEDF